MYHVHSMEKCYRAAKAINFLMLKNILLKGYSAVRLLQRGQGNAIYLGQRCHVDKSSHSLAVLVSD